MMPNTQESMPTPRGNKRVDKVEKMGWTTVDQPGVPYLAKKQELHIESTYQRTMISDTRVAAITREWSWISCGSLICAERADGTLWVVDGQHRMCAAMRRSDIQELPCLVFKSTGLEHEALAFFRANTVRGSVSPFDKLRSQLAFGDQLAIDAVNLMEDAGYKPSNSHGASNTVSCIAGFLTAMRQSRGALVKVWPLIAELHNGLQIKKPVFDALVYLARFGTDDITSPQWRARVVKRGINEITNSIDRARMLLSHSGAKLCAQATLEVINRGVSHDKRMGIDDTSRDDDE